MEIYLALLMLCYGAALWESSEEAVMATKIFERTVFIAIFLVIGLRGIDVGTDTYSYLVEYENSTVEWESKRRISELGFTFILKTLYSIGINFQYFTVIYALFIVGAFRYIGFGNSKNVVFILYFFVTMGFLGMSLSGMRQMVAVAIMVIGVTYYIKSEKKVVLILSQILAISIHNSAIGLLPVSGYLLLELDSQSMKKQIVSLIMLSALVALILNYINIGFLVNHRIEMYIKAEGLRVLNVLPVLLWCCVSICSLTIIYKTRVRFQNNFRERLYDKVALISAFFLMGIFLAALYVPMIDRYALYFQPFVIAHMVKRRNLVIKSARAKLIVNFVAITLSALFFIKTLDSDYFGIVPYSTMALG